MQKNVISITGLVQKEAGPLLTIGVAAPAISRQPSRKLPAPITANALVDTGAAMTIVCKSVIDQLGLQPVSYTTGRGFASGPVRCLLYNVDIVFRDARSDLVINFDVAMIDLSPHHFESVIGRDLLQQCDLSYRGFVGEFSLTVMR
jgi:hypothetical protein